MNNEKSGIPLDKKAMPKKKEQEVHPVNFEQIIKALLTVPPPQKVKKDKPAKTK